MNLIWHVCVLFAIRHCQDFTAGVRVICETKVSTEPCFSELNCGPKNKAGKIRGIVKILICLADKSRQNSGDECQDWLRNSLT